MAVGIVLLLGLISGCAKPRIVRFATFNASMNREAPGRLLADLERGDDPQIRAVAEIIQRVRPDVLLINEFDYDASGRAIEAFQVNYLATWHNGAEPIHYPFAFCDRVNTGVASGEDLDNDGTACTQPGTRGYGGDALGFGLFPGQYGMLVLSRYPILVDHRVSFTDFLWRDMPGALLPQGADGSPWYTDAELARLPLSSKAHWDLPVAVGRRVVHLLVSHPTPPAFDGPEGRNRRRNHDEIRLWADYLSGRLVAGMPRAIGPQPRRGSFETTLQGGFRGGRIESPKPPRSFVILGDLNADPLDGASLPGAIQQLLEHPRVASSPVPESAGAVEAAHLQGGANQQQRSDPRFDTADFADSGAGPGNLRCDYVLPSRDLKIVACGVFWPPTDDPLHRLVHNNASSDHRLVWLDVTVP
ncbi:MAG: endonuclease/exonuclease/phosphatase family protein [Phycisphaerae bacterium]|nr:endonuclease/exonuclease/phosphatase family protein [Phycisphaerae bacterium]MDW8260937.1 endonuclease/exonuclease/phosphatase family protein [Phycisphaerales bacterium]